MQDVGGESVVGKKPRDYTRLTQKKENRGQKKDKYRYKNRRLYKSKNRDGLNLVGICVILWL